MDACSFQRQYRTVSSAVWLLFFGSLAWLAADVGFSQTISAEGVTASEVGPIAVPAAVGAMPAPSQLPRPFPGETWPQGYLQSSTPIKTRKIRRLALPT